MPSHDPIRQRQFALDVVRTLREAHFDAFWAGGCVRDQLLKLVPKDYDVATNATPDEIRTLFTHRRTIPIGAAFGVITVLGPRSAGQIEVATFRADAAYSDGRRPDHVTFTNAQEDALRRDFTINGLFFDPVDERVIDYVDGQADLSAGLVRAIGNADERISEDKLRMLRAVRFAAAFGFAIESATLAAVQRMAGEISQVSAERIGMELRRMLVDPARTRAVSLLAETGLLAVVLPDVAELDASRMLQIGRRLAALEDPTLATVLAVLHHPTRNQPSESAELVRQVGRRLRLTNQEIDRAAWLLDTLPIAIDAKNAPWPRLQRVLVHTGAEELIALLEAIAGPDDPALAYCRERLALPAAELNPAPLVDGADLISHGLEPGPEFGTLLDRVRDAQLVEQIATRDEALALVDHLLASGQDE